MTRRTTTTSSTYSSSRHGRSPGSYNLDNQYQNQTIGNGSSNNSRKKTNTIDVMEMDRLRNGDLLMENSRKRKDMDEMSTISSSNSKMARLTSSSHHPIEKEKSSVRQNHSEIEKRRRNKMNTYINELSHLIPTCVSISRKMDKLTVLRLAVQHLKSLRGSIDAFAETSTRPSDLNDADLTKLILQSSKDEAGFLFVVDSARGRILYVSESVSDILNYSQRDLFGQSLFDVLHPKDIAKVKEQLSANSLNPPRDRLVDAKTMLPINVKSNGKLGSSIADSTSSSSAANVSNVPWICPGARRSFFCRMKTKPGMVFKEDVDQVQSYLESKQESYPRSRKRTTVDKKYRVIQCTGYLKSWSSSSTSGLSNETTDDEIQPGGCNAETDLTKNLELQGAMDCLVAVGRLQSSIDRPLDDAISRGLDIVPGVEFNARHTMDGMFTFIDPKATPILGYLPQELVGSSVYEHILYDDIPGLVEGHRRALKMKEDVKVAPIKFRCKDGRFVCLQSMWKQFQNPWNKEIDFIVAKYTLCNPDTFDAKVQPLIMGQTTFTVDSDMNFFTSDVSTDVSNNSGSGPNTRPASACLGKNIQDTVTSHVEASRIGKSIVDELRNGKTSPNISEDSSSNTSPLSVLLMRNNSSPIGGTSFIQNHETSSEVGDSINNRTLTNKSTNNSNFKQRSASLDTSIQQYSSSSSGNNTSNTINTSTTITMQQVATNNSGVANNQCINIVSQRLQQPNPNTEVFGSSPHSEDNDEATMAVIMNLLEADAGLGGPVDVSSFPWPLP